MCLFPSQGYTDCLSVHPFRKFYLEQVCFECSSGCWYGKYLIYLQRVVSSSHPVLYMWWPIRGKQAHRVFLPWIVWTSYMILQTSELFHTTSSSYHTLLGMIAIMRDCRPDLLAPKLPTLQDCAFRNCQWLLKFCLFLFIGLIPCKPYLWREIAAVLIISVLDMSSKWSFRFVDFSLRIHFFLIFPIMASSLFMQLQGSGRYTCIIRSLHSLL